MARTVLHGIAVSSGIAIGCAFFFNRKPDTIRHTLVPVESIAYEVDRLEEAIQKVMHDFALAKQHLMEDSSEQVELLDSHMLICTDPKLRGEAIRRIQEQRMNAEWALAESVEGLAKMFSKISSPYIRERIQDVRVVAQRITCVLEEMAAGLKEIPELEKIHDVDASKQIRQEARRILLAYDLTPAEALLFSLQRITAFATEQGGRTSHTGILARNLGIPAVVGVNGLGNDVLEGDLIIIDGIAGKILVEPSEADLEAYALRQGQFEAYQKKISTMAGALAETQDGYRITVLANVEKSQEAAVAIECGGEGVGLVRTEFSYIARTSLPKEDELYEEYARLTAAFAPRQVIFRTLDVGADKIFQERRVLDEPNPALGLRAIRYCLRHQDIFRRQLRAILRAGAHGNASLMFPLISGITELRQAKAILYEAIQELEAEKLNFQTGMRVGVMIELPASVFIAQDLAKEVDFFSIGTNDLIQYTLGADRNNKHVAHLHQPLHPAIIRAVKYVVDMAHKEGIPVCVCGEMAADPYCIPMLMGMSVDSISIAPQSIPGIKHIIRNSSIEQCHELLQQVLAASTVQSVNSLVRHIMYDKFPQDMIFFASQLDTEG